MGKTLIEWCDYSANPIKGRDIALNKVGHFCQKVDEGCRNCWASRVQLRLGLKEFSDPKRGKMQMFLDHKVLTAILAMKKPQEIFWEDCSDLFGVWVTDSWLDECFAVMALTPQHTHMVLTKQIERAFKYLTAKRDTPDKIRQAALRIALQAKIKPPSIAQWPLTNVKLGVSVNDQPSANQRIPTLLITPAVGHWLSIEPQTGPITLTYAMCVCPDKDDAFKNKYHMKGCPVSQMTTRRTFDRVVIGGENAARTKARPFNLQWPRSLVRQCHNAPIPWPAFVKQLGSFPTLSPVGTKDWDAKTNKAVRLQLKNRKGSDMKEWPDDLRVREGMAPDQDRKTLRAPTTLRVVGD